MKIWYAPESVEIFFLNFVCHGFFMVDLLVIFWYYLYICSLLLTCKPFTTADRFIFIYQLIHFHFLFLFLFFLTSRHISPSSSSFYSYSSTSLHVISLPLPFPLLLLLPLPHLLPLPLPLPLLLTSNILFSSSFITLALLLSPLGKDPPLPVASIMRYFVFLKFVGLLKRIIFCDKRPICVREEKEKKRIE